MATSFGKSKAKAVARASLIGTPPRLAPAMNVSKPGTGSPVLPSTETEPAAVGQVQPLRHTEVDEVAVRAGIEHGRHRRVVADLEHDEHAFRGLEQLDGLWSGHRLGLPLDRVELDQSALEGLLSRLDVPLSLALSRLGSVPLGRSELEMDGLEPELGALDAPGGRV